jgi:hypothetical protein
MSATIPPVTTLHLVEYDTTVWIWVPHIWPYDGFAGPEPWADAASRAVARRSWFQYMKRRALRADLVRMSLSRDGGSTDWTLAHAPNLGQLPRIARVTAHDRVNGVYTSLEQFLQLDRTDLNAPAVIQPFFSRHLGHGVTTLKTRTMADGSVAGVRNYGWELDDIWVSISIADFNLRYLERIRPSTDVLARAVAIDVDTGSGPERVRAQD